MRSLLALAAVEVFVWLALLLSALFISKIAFAINLGTETVLSRVATETLRVVVSGAIVVLLLLAWKWMVDAYFWRTIARREVPS